MSKPLSTWFFFLSPPAQCGAARVMAPIQGDCAVGQRFNYRRHFSRHALLRAASRSPLRIVHSVVSSNKAPNGYYTPGD